MSRLDRIVGYIAAASFFGAGVCFVFAGCGMLWNALFGEDRAVRDAHGRDSGGMSVGHFEERVVAGRDCPYAPAWGFGHEFKPTMSDWHSADADLDDGKRDVPDVRDHDSGAAANTSIPRSSDDGTGSVLLFFATNGAEGVVGRRASSDTRKDGSDGDSDLNGIRSHAAYYTKSH